MSIVLSAAMMHKKTLFNMMAVIGGLVLFLVAFNLHNDLFAIKVFPSLSPYTVAKQFAAPVSRLSSSSSSSSSSYKKQLLLVTKGRSGSSFTSALIRNDKDVFYAFEPLFPLHTEFGEDNLKCDAARVKAYNILRAFLTCNFTQVNGVDLNNYQIRNSGVLAQQFLRCARSNGVGYVHMECLLALMRTCHKKSVAFSKVIRFPMQWAEVILKELPSLKILYLIRDPRAVLKSQATVFRKFTLQANASSVSGQHCGELEEDASEIARLQALYPGRVHVIQYERGAMDQIKYGMELYKFAGLSFTNQTVAYIKSLSQPPVGDETKYLQAYSLHRTNSSLTMNRWRYSTGYSIIERIDKVCGKVYPRFGYLPATSQKDLESNRPLVDMSVSLNGIDNNS